MQGRMIIIEEDSKSKGSIKQLYYQAGTFTSNRTIRIYDLFSMNLL